MIKALSMLGLLIALTVALWPSSGAARYACGDRATMIQRLEDQYGEGQIWVGSVGGNVFEVWVSCPDGSWTILKSYPSGVACLVAAGEGWFGEPCEDEGKPA